MLKINEKYKIEIEDANNVALYELKEVTDSKTAEKKKVWKNDGYFFKVSQALKRAFDKYLRNKIDSSAAKSVEELLEEIKRIEKDLEKIDIIMKRVKVKG